MVGVSRMGKEKKNEVGDSLEAIAAIELPDDVKAGPQVKLRPAFKEALQRVALHANQDMGILIEKYMRRFVMREDRRIAKLLSAEPEEGE